MKNILVSGTSGIVGYGILRSLKKSGLDLNLIGTTIYEDSVAQGFCDTFEKAPPTNSDIYIDWLINTINKHKIQMLIPGIEADLYKWTECKDKIEATGAKILLNNLDLVSFSKDKWVFYQQLIAHKLTMAIPTILETNFEKIKQLFGLPFLLKPRVGFGSKGIVKVFDEEVFKQHQSKIGEVLMVQPYVGNDNEEYSASAFCDGKGDFYASMGIRRKLSSDGFTEKAEVVEMSELNEVIRALCKCFKPIGPTNFQFRKHEDEYKLLEINPRVSSSTSIRTAFGYNESAMAVSYFLDGKIPEQPTIKKGRAVRYSEDFIFYDSSNNI